MIKVSHHCLQCGPFSLRQHARVLDRYSEDRHNEQVHAEMDKVGTLSRAIHHS